jgi:hypothetical protein
MRRREFIAGVGSAAAWPVVASAQQGERVRRIGVLMSLASDDAEGQARNAALLQGLGRLGWIVGRSVWMEYRWAAGNSDKKTAKALQCRKRFWCAPTRSANETPDVHRRAWEQAPSARRAPFWVTSEPDY